MLASLCLITCGLVFAQEVKEQGDPSTLTLARGQEIVYQGRYTEENLGEGTHSTRSFQMESRVFVLDAVLSGYDVALYTTVRLLGLHEGSGDGRLPASVRLQLAHVDHQGKLTPREGSSLLIPLVGPPTSECGQFVEAPHGIGSPNQSWQVPDGSRPVRTWTCLGWDSVGGVRCIKVEGIQQSSDWDQPRADQSAWRRLDRVWLLPRQGITYKVERTIERRQPAHDHPSERSILELEMHSSLLYPGQLYEGRRRDIMQAVSFAQAVAPYLTAPATFTRKTFDNLLLKMQHYVDNEPPTPYREAVLQVMRHVDAARRGESPPSLMAEEQGQGAQALILGERAPDFVAINVVNRQSVGLNQFVGKPTLMVFYSPRSSSAQPVLRFAQRMKNSYGYSVNVAGFALADSVEAARSPQADFYLSIPVFAGGSMKQAYGVTVTPKVVILDASGIARAAYEGWGPEMASAAETELKRRMPGRK
jgi:hypothetical protein